MVAGRPVEVDLVVSDLAATVHLEERQASEHDWYSIYFQSTEDRSLVRFPMLAVVTDALGRKKLVDGQYVQIIDPVDAALDAWAFLGADRYDLLFVARGPKVIASAITVGLELYRRLGLEIPKNVEQFDSLGIAAGSRPNG